MAQKRKPYALRLEKDKTARKQIAILRMGGVSLRDIAKITDRNVRTITKEIGRQEHKTLVQHYVISVSKQRLPKEDSHVIEKAVKTKET